MAEAKRDFIFIDESGESEEVTPYYIQGLLHITDDSLKSLNTHLGAFRYFGSIKKELKSTRLNSLQREKLLNILKITASENEFIKASSVYLRKEDYEGFYLREKDGKPKDPNFFRHLIIRRLLEFHFSNFLPQSEEVELIIDRFHSDENRELQLRRYLRTDEYNILPQFLHIIQADSRYVDLLQIADWIAGSVKEKYFIHPEREFNDLFNYINVKEIKK